jgi:sugar phosphate isomerase/epimerase
VEPHPKFGENLEAFRKRCEQFAELGAPLVYTPCATAGKFGVDDYARGVENLRRVAAVAQEFQLKVAA